MGLVRIPILILALAAVLSACKTVDDDRIPRVAVRIDFPTVGLWDAYGVSGALQHRRFIKNQYLPVGFPYTATMYTGFGGVLLVSGFDGEFKAYDLACPVECRTNVLIEVQSDLNIAECPVCHSTYDIYRFGSPLSGVASQKAYALTRYNVGPGTSGQYMLISR